MCWPKTRLFGASMDTFIRYLNMIKYLPALQTPFSCREIDTFALASTPFVIILQTAW